MAFSSGIVNVYFLDFMYISLSLEEIDILGDLLKREEGKWLSPVSFVKK